MKLGIIASILLGISSYAAVPSFRTVELTFSIDAQNVDTNNTVYIYQSTDLLSWTTLTNMPASTNVFKHTFQMIPSKMFWKLGISNAWSSVESDVISSPEPLNGVKPLISWRVLPVGS